MIRVPAIGGFPAHAGMDRWRALTMTCWRRFPRPRGDGPITAVRGIDPQLVSPPTRGWTSCATCRFWLDAGFPAHAGMDH